MLARRYMKITVLSGVLNPRNKIVQSAKSLQASYAGTPVYEDYSIIRCPEPPE